MSAADVPAVRLTKEGKDMSIHSLYGAITAESVGQLVRDFQDGKLAVCAHAVRCWHSRAFKASTTTKPRFETEGGVIIGTEANFGELMADTLYNVVEFCLQKHACGTHAHRGFQTARSAATARSLLFVGARDAPRLTLPQPEYAKVARELDNLRNVKLVKFDGEAHPRIRFELGVTQYPAIKLFVNGFFARGANALLTRVRQGPPQWTTTGRATGRRWPRGSANTRACSRFSSRTMPASKPSPRYDAATCAAQSADERRAGQQSARVWRVRQRHQPRVQELCCRFAQEQHCVRAHIQRCGRRQARPCRAGRDALQQGRGPLQTGQLLRRASQDRDSKVAYGPKWAYDSFDKFYETESVPIVHNYTSQSSFVHANPVKVQLLLFIKLACVQRATPDMTVADRRIWRGWM